MSQTQTLTDSRAASFGAPPRLLRAPSSFTCASSDGRFGAAWVHLTGELDLAAAPQLEQTLREAQLDASLVVLDLRELAFMDCAGLRVIIEADERARRAGRRLTVVRGAANVDKLFTMTGASDVIEISEHDHASRLRIERSRSSPGLNTAASC